MPQLLYMTCVPIYTSQENRAKHENETSPISFAVLAEADEAPRLRAAHRLKLYMSHAPLPGNVATSSLPIKFRFLL